jgi:hypothetical protein
MAEKSSAQEARLLIALVERAGQMEQDSRVLSTVCIYMEERLESDHVTASPSLGSWPA